MSLSPISGRVIELLKTRCEGILDLSASFGFGEKLDLSLEVTRIDGEGIIIDGEDEDDTRPLRGAWCELVVEGVVNEDVCNLSGNMHGGAVAYVIDLASALPLLCLSGNAIWPTSGVTTNLQIFYLSPAPSGCTIQIVSRVVNFGKVVAVIECKVYNKATGRLLMTATHVKQDDVKPAAPYGSKL